MLREPIERHLETRIFGISRNGANAAPSPPGFAILQRI
jgi:hypothetical protein